MTSPNSLASWVATALGHSPADPALFSRALTHASHGAADYERLEFLGDRVLGVIAAAWLYRLFPDEPEGKLSRRYNAIVSRESCAEVGRQIGVPQQLRLGKQARDDGAVHSGNVVGDAVEALIGALFLEGGLPAAEAFVHRAWADLVTRQANAPKHPKSALQEWAAAHQARPPVYTLIGRAGPHHAPRFTVTVSIPGRAEAQAEGASKQEAETAAAQALLEKIK
ncbi:ribonuclease III [Sphingomonas oleivorans]|uniref:Ribonuclease 3 n=1 Tax=Sphingomonas oleivorans TaxID=1735121 RepID=A0A2T5FTB4_9SPHN|nr:ribonuclease III [Sphingomonas oleivorans]PTQ07308.1 ribonuclease III [Sphingomonas oleivorans]